MSAENPIAIFERWYAEARGHPKIVDASAMALATADRSGRPTVRMVLLKSCDERGFVFYTNIQSAKGRALDANPQAELCFYWAPLGRQVRVNGAVERVSDIEVDAYFATRPRLSQMGAWASEQSAPMPSRFALPPRVAAMVLKFGAAAVPRPPQWSGFRLVPNEMEFWREGLFRHHERRLFTRTSSGWDEKWLFP